MKITHCKINHLVNPVGYDFFNLTASYLVEEARGMRQVSGRILVSASEDLSDPIYDSGAREDMVNTGFELPISLAPMTRYYWQVQVKDDAGDSAKSEVQFFETGKTVTGNDCEWKAHWITPDASKEVQAVVYKTLTIEKPVKSARAYMTGLGVYEFYLNQEKQGDECLMPGFCAYDSWIQYQTYELALRQGENTLEIMLGDGWYKGNFGLIQKYENYGDRLAAIAEIHILYEDGTEEVVGTDETWQARPSKVVATGIYCGETYDATLDDSAVFKVHPIDLGYDRLSPRLSPALTIHERLKPKVIYTPAGETVLDMGQNMVGWLSFRTKAPAGTRLHFQVGETLQMGNFYRDNLRRAEAAFTYISDGQEREVRQHFTFFGFRYVKLEGWESVDPEDFTGLVLHSEMEERGSITTSDPLVNQLIHNAKWGMKGNFLDVPTDCPQRDERYGWTGDAQIFSGTASFFMDTYAFYAKYGRDVYAEQKKLNGSVPDVVPVANYSGDASTAWGEAATVIPWNAYLHSGDRGILRSQYPSMKAWVDYMKGEDDKDGSRRLWLTGTHYGDWLALDGNIPGGVYGATDPGYIASAYYYYSTSLVAKAAKVLAYKEEAAYYEKLAEEIKAAFLTEYFTGNGRLAIDTMTAYVMALYMDLVPAGAKVRLKDGLLRKLQKNFYHLNTGFVGTPYLCRVLSENGMNDIAYHLLLEKGYPGWLYEVLMGATTIWERWNSILPDGTISGTEMNSLNHYSYGSIVEWMFRNMNGINPCEEGAGFKHFRLSPTPNYQIASSSAVLHSAAGTIESSWELKEKKLTFRFAVPFDSQAEIVLPDADLDVIREMAGSAENLRQVGRAVAMTVGAGTYVFTYEPTVPYRKVYSLDSTWEELKANPKTWALLQEEYQTKEDHIPFESELCTLYEMTWGPFTCLPQEKRDKLDRLLREVE